MDSTVFVSKHKNQRSVQRSHNLLIIKEIQSKCFDFSFRLLHTGYFKPAKLDTRDLNAITGVNIPGLELVASQSAIAVWNNVITSKDALIMVAC